MVVCDEYFGDETSAVSGPFDLDADPAAPMAKSPEIVQLEDGDSYTIEIIEVQKKIGNQTLRMLAYNGSIPGPILRAPQ